jgi:hypothetical protein
VELRCTCGAYLPSDARFCHKCGKPQYEEDAARLAAENTPAPVQAPLDVPGPTKPSPIGFGNLRAVTITIAVAAVTLIPLTLAMIAPPLSLIVLAAAGYCAAYFYRKQTSQPLSAGGGAYLGVMTGIWLFVVFALCAAVVSVKVSSPADLAVMKATLARVPGASNMLDDPHQFIVTIGESLILLFFLSTLSAAFGGMLAARTLARRSQP